MGTRTPGEPATRTASQRQSPRHPGRLAPIHSSLFTGPTGCARHGAVSRSLSGHTGRDSCPRAGGWERGCPPPPSCILLMLVAPRPPATTSADSVPARLPLSGQGPARDCPATSSDTEQALGDPSGRDAWSPCFCRDDPNSSHLGTEAPTRLWEHAHRVLGVPRAWHLIILKLYPRRLGSSEIIMMWCSNLLKQ